MDWLNLIAVQGTLESLLQHHKFPILGIKIFFIQPSHALLSEHKRRNLHMLYFPRLIIIFN